jgi:hypothetical protein
MCSDLFEVRNKYVAISDVLLRSCLRLSTGLDPDESQRHIERQKIMSLIDRGKKEVSKNSICKGLKIPSMCWLCKNNFGKMQMGGGEWNDGIME